MPSGTAGMAGFGSGGMGGGAQAYEGPLYVVPGGNGALVRGFAGPLSDLTVGVEATYAGPDHRLEFITLWVPDGPASFDETDHEVNAPFETVVARSRSDLGGRAGHTTPNYQVAADTLIDITLGRHELATGDQPAVPLEDISRLWVIRGDETEHVADWP